MTATTSEDELRRDAEYSVALVARAPEVSARRIPGYPGLWYVTPLGSSAECETVYVLADSDRVVHPMPAANGAEVNCLAITEMLAGSNADFDDDDLDDA